MFMFFVNIFYVWLPGVIPNAILLSGSLPKVSVQSEDSDK